MSEIISCPSCQKKVQVPEALGGQDVQCPTCGATFVAHLPGTSAPAPSSGGAHERWETTERPASWKDEEAGRRPPPYDDRGDYRRPAHGEYGRSDDYRRRDLMPHRGAMILTLGIVGILLCNIVAPFAWVMGNADIAEIRNGRMDPDGEGLTQAGRILGMIGTALMVLSFCLVGLWFLLIITATAGRNF
jgi:hypothetical protein